MQLHTVLSGVLLLLIPAVSPAETGERLSCGGDEIRRGGGCKLVHAQQLPGFKVFSTGGSSLNRLTITPSGLTVDNRPQELDIDGSVVAAQLADLDSDGWPEVYVYVASAGSGSYGSLVAFAVNNGKSMSPIYLPPIQDEGQAAVGYMGHDEFAVVENRLVRRFPIYHPQDRNAHPSGGTRHLQYRLVPGEAGWILQLQRPTQ